MLVLVVLVLNIGAFKGNMVFSGAFFIMELVDGGSFLSK
jgi:hypothetical protein